MNKSLKMAAQLDFGLAVKARNRAIAAVKAPSAWWAAAEQRVRLLAVGGHEFTTDDVWSNLAKPPEPRALGAVMNSLSRQGVIVRTGRYVETAQVSRHGAPIAVWRGVDG